MFNRSISQAYVRIIKCSLILGDIVSAETTLNKVLELDPTFKQNLVAEQRDLEHVRRYVKEAEVAYEAKDYRKVNINININYSSNISTIQI